MQNQNIHGGNMLPFTEEIIDEIKIRTFSDQTSSEEFIWHRDYHDRKVVVISCGNGWRYQLDDNVPIIINTNDTFFIPKATYHRVIKGSGSLVVKIIETT